MDDNRFHKVTGLVNCELYQDWLDLRMNMIDEQFDCATDAGLVSITLPRVI